MVNRPAGGPRSKRWERAPLDWYLESPRVVEQLMHGVDFGDDLIWDPCCGSGNVLDVARRFGHETFGSDLVDRGAGRRHPFRIMDVLLQSTLTPVSSTRATSIISNPPYSYEADIAERIIAHVLERLPIRRAAFIVPIAFLASQERWGKRRLLRWLPSHVCVYRERHTMPPGHLVDQMVNPFEGGMADYCAVVFTRPHRWRTELIWLKPGPHPHPPKRAHNQGAKDHHG